MRLKIGFPGQIKSAYRVYQRGRTITNRRKSDKVGAEKLGLLALGYAATVMRSESSVKTLSRS